MSLRPTPPKDGALSTIEGRVDITTRIEDDALQLCWIESGGPAVAGEPQRQGFGSRLSELSIVQQLGGTLKRDWRPAGLVVDDGLLLKRLVR